MSARHAARRVALVLGASIIMAMCMVGIAQAQGTSGSGSAAAPPVAARVTTVDGATVTPDISYWGTIWSKSISQSTANNIGNKIDAGTPIATAIGACIPDAGPFIAVAVAVAGASLAYDFHHYASGGIAIKVQQCYVAPLLRCTFDGATIATVPD